MTSPMNGNDNPFAFNMHSTWNNEKNDSRQARLRLWNVAFRVGAFISSVAALILILVSRETSSNIELANGSRGTGTATYKISASFVFFVYVNVVVGAYAMVLTISAFVMWTSGQGQTTPASLMWVVLVLNLILAGFLLLAFAAALSVQVVLHAGLSLGDVEYIAVCKYFTKYCATNDFALASCLLAYSCLSAGTVIDACCIYILSAT